MTEVAGARVAPLRVMTTRSAIVSVIAALLAACGTDSTSSEVVVDKASGATLLGASANALYWSVPAAAGTRVLGSSLATLPGEAEDLAMATGPSVHAADHVVFVADGYMMRASVGAAASRLATATAEAIGETAELPPRLIWAAGDKLSWGVSEADRTVAIPRATRVDHVRASFRRIYAAVDSSQGRRLVYVDRTIGLVQGLVASTEFAASFPGGAKDGATYRGRIVGTENDDVFWLVEESVAGTTLPSRAVLALVTDRGEISVLLDRIQKPSAFFVADDGFYWQEGDALLHAPRDGGAASIAAKLSGTAGALADGFVYYVSGSSIERLAL